MTKTDFPLTLLMPAQHVYAVSAVISAGRTAWRRLKSSAPEQRQLWREVGEALLEGRYQNSADQDFGAWCLLHGFDMDAAERSNAMWLAENWDSVWDRLKPSQGHPTTIRKAMRKLDALAQAPSASLDISAPAEESLARLAKVIPVASKVRKLAARDFQRWVTKEVLPAIRLHGRKDRLAGPPETRGLPAQRY